MSVPARLVVTFMSNSASPMAGTTKLAAGGPRADFEGGLESLDRQAPIIGVPHAHAHLEALFPQVAALDLHVDDRQPRGDKFRRQRAGSEQQRGRAERRDATAAGSHPGARPKAPFRCAYSRASCAVNAPAGSCQIQFRSTVPGVLRRAEESRPSTSCAGMIASRATDPSAARI